MVLLPFDNRCKMDMIVYVVRRRVIEPGDLDLWPFDLESGVRVTCSRISVERSPKRHGIAENNHNYKPGGENTGVV